MPARPESPLWPSELAVSDAIGRLMEFWGFKRNMGRIWAVLFLTDDPLSAKDLRERLHLSSGAVSMTLAELMRWGVVKKVWIQGERRDWFVAEGNLWKMISRVLSERESVEISEAIDTLEGALREAERRVRSRDAAERRRAEVQRDRIRQLLDLARLGKRLLDALVNNARVDASPLLKVLLGFEGVRWTGVAASRHAGPMCSIRLGDLLETRPVAFFLVSLIVLSVLPYPGIEASLRPLFLVGFGVEIAIRIALLSTGRTKGSRLEWAFLAIDIAAFVSFLPFEWWLSPGARDLIRLLRLVRLLALLRFARALAADVYQVITRREQLQQFGLVTGTVVALAFVSSIVLMQLAVPYSYDGASGPGAPQGFLDELWWAFRQLEDGGNIVQNLHAHPLLIVISLTLTTTGVFIISYLIGIGTNIVDLVVRAERRRPVGYRRHSLVVGSIGQSELLVREFVRIYEKNRGIRHIRFRRVWDWVTGRAPAPGRFILPRMALLGPDAEPPAFLYDRGMRWIVYRQGEGGDVDALEVAAAGHAKRAILLARREAGHDADAITVASLGAFRAVNRTAHAFVEVLDSDNEDLVRMVGGEGTFPLDVPRFLGLFLCHHLIVPRIEEVFDDLLTAKGCEFYTHIYVDREETESLAAMAGQTLSFEQMARAALANHGIVLAGVFLGDDSVGRIEADLIPVDRLVEWVNPAAIPSGRSSRGLGPSRTAFLSRRSAG